MAPPFPTPLQQQVDVAHSIAATLAVLTRRARRSVRPASGRRALPAGVTGNPCLPHGVHELSGAAVARPASAGPLRRTMRQSRSNTAPNTPNLIKAIRREDIEPMVHCAAASDIF